MGNIVLVIIGLAMLAYSLSIHGKMLHVVRNTPLVSRWLWLLVLVIFFIVAYIAYGYWLLTETIVIDSDAIKTFISFVFLFGAIFVLMTVSLIYTTVHNLTLDKKQKNEDLEQGIRERTQDLEKKTIELEKMNNLMVNRELKMIELKKEVQDLQRESS